MPARLQPRQANLLLRPFQAFFELEAAGGIVLLACAALAMAWANGPAADAYFGLWRASITVGGGPLVLSKPLSLWVNDGLMAVFFFVVGLEIKRELLTGELSSFRKAALPMIAAVAGMAAPAAIYAALNVGQPTMRGWGVPMATDIAFALGVLALLGRRVPVALRIFLTAVAIVDDLGAVVVIALFYTAQLSWAGLGIAALVLAVLILVNRAGVHHAAVYGLLGLLLWVAVLKSGVHATVAGVLLAMTIPARRRIAPDAFLERGRRLLDAFAKSRGAHDLTEDQRDAVYSLEVACRQVEAPLTRMELALHPWVAYAVMPIFALANAGVALPADFVSALGDRITLGVILGLILGKQAGVTASCWLAVRLGAATLPTGATWRQLYGVAALCGIGFTMSLFVASLAFTDPAALDGAKLGVLAASLISGIYGFSVLAQGRAIEQDGGETE
jgi:NhaA family Na+:H+ antiporter